MEYRRWQLQIAITVLHAPGPGSAAIVEKRPKTTDSQNSPNSRKTGEMNGL